MKDDVLIRVAKEAPSTPEALANTKGFPRPLVNEHGPEILARVEASVDLPSEQLGAPPLPLETPADRVGIDALWSLVSTFSRGRGIYTSCGEQPTVRWPGIITPFGMDASRETSRSQKGGVTADWDDP